MLDKIMDWYLEWNETIAMVLATCLFVSGCIFGLADMHLEGIYNFLASIIVANFRVTEIK